MSPKRKVYISKIMRCKSACKSKLFVSCPPAPLLAQNQTASPHHLAFQPTKKGRKKSWFIYLWVLQKGEFWSQILC